MGAWEIPPGTLWRTPWPSHCTCEPAVGYAGSVSHQAPNLQPSNVCDPERRAASRDLRTVLGTPKSRMPVPCSLLRRAQELRDTDGARLLGF